jgi:CheY-like chemotaxis protein
MHLSNKMADKKYNILIADDDSDDRQMLKEAFEENNFVSNIHFVENGEELVDYLKRKGKYENTYESLDLILLDLNMPKKDGREALREIKSDPVLKSIPVIVLTTSNVKDDVVKSYNSGVNCFISKPASYIELIEVTRTIIKYWFETVKLPGSMN